MSTRPPVLPAVYTNGLHIGTFELQDDGSYAFWPAALAQGYYTRDLLIWITDELNKLNKTWEEESF